MAANDISTGSFAHTLEEIDDATTEVSDAKGSFATLAAALAAKQDELTFDTEPTDGSTNPVTSDGILNAIAAAVSESYSLGDLIPDASNLNNYTTPGNYYISTPASAQTLYNCPATYSFRLTVTTLNGDARFIQTIEEAIYNSSETTALNIYKRAYTVRGWGDWYLFTGTVVPPVNVPAQ